MGKGFSRLVVLVCEVGLRERVRARRKVLLWLWAGEGALVKGKVLDIENLGLSFLIIDTEKKWLGIIGP